MEESRKFFLIKDVIFTSINKDLKNSFIIKLLEKKRDEIFGEDLVKYIKIEKILNNKLYIGCKHQGLVQSLSLNKDNVLAKIKEIFNNSIKIKDIIFYFDSFKK